MSRYPGRGGRPEAGRPSRSSRSRRRTSQAPTRAYNPQGYFDVCFLLGSSGRVAYINSPTSTMSQLLARAGGFA